MKKTLLIPLVFLMGNLIFSQKMITRAGEIKFDASMPDLVEIAAVNNTASCILDGSTGDFATLVLIKAFKFKAPLMEEHFNENYLESSKFPKATFKGKITNFDAKKLSATKTTYDLEGDLTIHNITKKIKTKISLALNGSKISATSAFFIKPQDYNVEIPSLVKEKISEKIKISINYILEAN